MQKVHGKGFEQTDFFSDKPLYINNCGFIRNGSDQYILRERGRVDYHFIFNARGRVLVEGRELREGEMYFYPPRVKHEYSYQNAEKGLYFWIHFSGYEVTELLKRYGITQGVYPVKQNSREIEDLFVMMIKSFTEGWQCADEYASGLLRALLPLVVSPKNAGSPFFSAIHKLGDVTENVTVKELADMYKMSEGNFIRQFSSYVGMTPHAYRISRRLEVARDLLSSTDMSVGEIAQSVNIQDPLYFTRLFTKKTGMSPGAYRKKFRING